MPKNQVVRLDSKADVVLTNLKHEVFTKKNKKIYKSQILNWLVLYAFTFKCVRKRFYKWVDTL